MSSLFKEIIQWSEKPGARVRDLSWLPWDQQLVLANIVKFPLCGWEKNGGAAFVIVYLICLAAVSLPVLLSEALIGRTAQTSPVGAFRKLGGAGSWALAGKGVVITGFIVSAFL